MSIAYLVPQFPKPSETFVSRELLTLRKLGLEVRPFSFRAPSPSESALLDPVSRSLVQEVQYLTAGRTIRQAIRAWPNTLRGWRENRAVQQAATCKSNASLRLLRVGALAREMSQQGITHVHAHWPYATQIAYQIHKLSGLSLSVSIHAHEVEHDGGHFPHLFESVQFASFCNRAAMERLLSKLPPQARDRCHLIYHGVDLERFAPLPFPSLEGPLRVISAGRLTRSKGFDRLVRSCAAYRAAGGAVELTLLGCGEQEGVLRALAAQHGFAQYLNLPGWLPHDQVAQQLARAHLFALMADTNFNDGLPNVVLEAMASGRPVVISPLPAAEEAVADGEEGYLLGSAHDEAGMVRVLGQLAARLEDLPSMGRAARERVEKSFDEISHARRLKQLFDQVTPSRPATIRTVNSEAALRGEALAPGPLLQPRP